MTEREKRLQAIRERANDFSHEGKIGLVFTARDDLLWLLAEIERLQQELITLNYALGSQAIAGCFETTLVEESSDD